MPTDDESDRLVHQYRARRIWLALALVGLAVIEVVVYFIRRPHLTRPWLALMAISEFVALTLVYLALVMKMRKRR
jgi:hypothetical protein